MSDTNKEEQRKNIVDIMHSDEDLGLYTTPSSGEGKGQGEQKQTTEIMTKTRSLVFALASIVIITLLALLSMAHSKIRELENQIRIERIGRSLHSALPAAPVSNQTDKKESV
jgi:hypothetical protein